MIYYESNVFYKTGDEDLDLEPLQKIFTFEQVKVIGELYKVVDHTIFFRGSCNLAYRLGVSDYFDFCNVTKWLPPLRQYAYNTNMYFQDMAQIRFEMCMHGDNKQFFIRPCSPFKTFAGQIYTPENFITECMYINQTNGDEYQLCGITDYVRTPKVEWRCIMINNKYVSGSQYLLNGELELHPYVPSHVIEFANKIAKDPFFQNKFEFVLDICSDENDKIYLLEVNGFQTSSFYLADYELVYDTWRKSIYNI